jgi:hypothetical protein
MEEKEWPSLMFKKEYIYYKKKKKKKILLVIQSVIHVFL